MSRTNKDRHKWKRKERRRTGQSDPNKIKLHRDRYLARLEQQAVAQNGYRPIVFHARLKFDPEEWKTELLVDEEKVDEVMFMTEDPASCHYAVTAYKSDFNPIHEADVLAEHVGRVKYLGQPCHLAGEAEGIRVCASIVNCRYRRWNAEQAIAECKLS